jgi:hypothetical protein
VGEELKMATTLIHEHPVWEELQSTTEREYRLGAAAALFEDVGRPDWASAVTPRATMFGDHPLEVLAVAYRGALRCSMAMALTDDVRGDWERFLAAQAEHVPAA